jgi:hypothetical protein
VKIHFDYITTMTLMRKSRGKFSEELVCPCEELSFEKRHIQNLVQQDSEYHASKNLVILSLRHFSMVLVAVALRVCMVDPQLWRT